MGKAWSISITLRPGRDGTHIVWVGYREQLDDTAIIFTLPLPTSTPIPASAGNNSLILLPRKACLVVPFHITVVILVLAMIIIISRKKGSHARPSVRIKRRPPPPSLTTRSGN